MSILSLWEALLKCTRSDDTICNGLRNETLISIIYARFTTAFPHLYLTYEMKKTYREPSLTPVHYLQDPVFINSQNGFKNLCFKIKK